MFGLRFSLLSLVCASLMAGLFMWLNFMPQRELNLNRVVVTWPPDCDPGENVEKMECEEEYIEVFGWPFIVYGRIDKLGKGINMLSIILNLSTLLAIIYFLFKIKKRVFHLKRCGDPVISKNSSDP